MGPAAAPPPPETPTCPSGGGGAAGAPSLLRAGPEHRIPPRQLLDQLRAERLHLEREIAVEKGRSALRRLRPAAAGSTHDRIELGTLVLRAQAEFDLAEFEHHRALEAIRVAADREAERILTAARREAALMAIAAEAIITDLSTDAHLAGAIGDDRVEAASPCTEGSAVARSDRAVPKAKPRARQTGVIPSGTPDVGTARQARHVDAG